MIFNSCIAHIFECNKNKSWRNVLCVNWKKRKHNRKALEHYEKSILQTYHRSLSEAVFFFFIHCYYQPVCEAHVIVITDFDISTFNHRILYKGKIRILKIDVDIDCLSPIDKFKISLEASKPCFRIIYKIWYLLAWFPRKIKHLGVLNFDSHCSFCIVMSYSYSALMTSFHSEWLCSFIWVPWLECLFKVLISVRRSITYPQNTLFICDRY